MSSLNECFVVFIVLHQKFRCIESVRTFFHALAAVQASFDLLHLLLPLFCQPRFTGRSPEHQTHSCTVVDLDSRWAWHTISASAAEVASQLFFIFCYPVLKFPGQLRRDRPDRRGIHPVQILFVFPRSAPHEKTEADSYRHKRMPNH